MEDLDPPREQPGAADAILASLEAHGLLWDDQVLWQSSRQQAYRDALSALDQTGQLFRCDCTRALLGPGGACHGRCLSRQEAVASPWALRVKVPGHINIRFRDGLQGTVQEALGATLPDFTLLRKDGLFAYQLAVVVDDGYQGITHVVRGSDLLDSTPRQLYLQQLLGLAQPHYTHHPVITNAAGQKFSKQTHAPALDDRTAVANLRQALRFLGQPPPPEELGSPHQLLAFAAAHWLLERVPAALSQDAAVLDRPR